MLLVEIAELDALTKASSSADQGVSHATAVIVSVHPMADTPSACRGSACLPAPSTRPPAVI